MYRCWDLYKSHQGIATWTGQGIGRFTGPGRVSFPGSLFFRTPSMSQGGKLSYLNNIAHGVFEYEVDGIPYEEVDLQ